MNFPIGLQLYSVREDLENDFEGTLRKVKALGYDTVEFAGLYGHSAEEVRSLCREIGLIPLLRGFGGEEPPKIPPAAGGSRLAAWR